MLEQPELVRQITQLDRTIRETLDKKVVHISEVRATIPLIRRKRELVAEADKRWGQKADPNKKGKV